MVESALNKLELSQTTDPVSGTLYMTPLFTPIQKNSFPSDGCQEEATTIQPIQRIGWSSEQELIDVSVRLLFLLPFSFSSTDLRY